MFRLLVPLLVSCLLLLFFIFFFNDTATTEIYTLSYTTLFRSTGPSGDRPKTPRREVLDDSVLQLIAKLLTPRERLVKRFTAQNFRYERFATSNSERNADSPSLRRNENGRGLHLKTRTHGELVLAKQ